MAGLAQLLLLSLAAVAPAQSDSAVRRPFRFAVLGHIRGGPDGTLNPKLGELLGRVRALQPDFVVLTGDIIWGDAEGTPPDTARVLRQWERVDSALATLGVPVYRTPGNHDISDLGTKRLWWSRYGAVPQVLERYGSRLILLASAWIPKDDDSVPQVVVRPAALDSAQVAWLRTELARPGSDHDFLFLHHLLWWDPEAGWWSAVHPLLRPGRVRMVFGGDYGPLKFSHLTRDSILYVQSSIENVVDLDILKSLETSRVLSAQFDNFLLVSVAGPAVDLRVHTVAELRAPQYQPGFYTAMMPGPGPSGWRKWLAIVATPRRLLAAGGLGLLAFGAGWLVGRVRMRRAT